MTTEQLEREQKYHIAMALAGVLLRQGIIDDNEIRVIDTIMLAKFRPIIASIYPENDLIQTMTRGKV